MGFPVPWYARKNALWAVLALFTVLYGLISFPNHLLFRTYALDLGLYTHALWHYANGNVHDSSLFMEHAQPVLADHFDLYLPLLSPLVYVFGTWTLLLVQWASMLLGAWGVRRLLLVMGMPQGIALLGMVLFLAFFGMFAAVSFDYHSNVVATMVLPWFLIALWRQQHLRAVILFVLMLIAKENLGIWLGIAVLVLATMPELSRPTRRLSLALGLIGISWSMLVIGVLMPALSNSQDYAHFDYGILGRSLPDIPGAFLERPGTILSALFIDHRGLPNGTAIKLEFWWMMLLAGGWAFLLSPRWGLMALPLLAQKMLHDEPGKWSVVAQYGVEFAPLIAIAAAVTLSRFPQCARSWLATGALVASFGCLVRFMDNTVAYQDRSRIRFYQKEHYTKPYNFKETYKALERIPPDAIVSAQSPLVPHLALREAIHQYPIIGEASFIALLPGESPYPLDTLGYQRRLQELDTSQVWVRTYQSAALVLFERKSED